MIETLNMSRLAPTTLRTYKSHFDRFCNWHHEYYEGRDLNPGEPDDLALMGYACYYVRLCGNKPASLEVGLAAIRHHWKLVAQSRDLPDLERTKEMVAILKRWYSTSPKSALVLSRDQESWLLGKLLDKCYDSYLSDWERIEWIATTLSWLFALIAHRGGDFLPSKESRALATEVVKPWSKVLLRFQVSVDLISKDAVFQFGRTKTNRTDTGERFPWDHPAATLTILYTNLLGWDLAVPPAEKERLAPFLLNRTGRALTSRKCEYNLKSLVSGRPRWKGLTLYTARRTGAANAERDGIPLRIISQGMRHRSIQSTLKYLSRNDGFGVKEYQQSASAIFRRVMAGRGSGPGSRPHKRYPFPSDGWFGNFTSTPSRVRRRRPQDKAAEEAEAVAAEGRGGGRIPSDTKYNSHTGFPLVKKNGRGRGGPKPTEGQ